MRALLGLDQLQRGADGIRGGIGGAAQQAVGLAQLDQHGAEIIALQQVGAALLGAHLALAQLHHGLDHLVHARVGGGIQDLRAIDVEAILGSGGLHLVHGTHQDHAHELFLEQTGSGAENAGVHAFGEDDGLGLGLDFFDQFLKHCSSLPI